MRIINILAFYENNKKSLLFLWLVPIVYLLLFGSTYKSEVVEHIPTVIYDQDQSSNSRVLISCINDVEKYKIVAYAQNEATMNEILASGDALLAVEIPTGFSQDLKNGKSPSVMVITDASNLMFHNAVMSSMGQIVQTFSAAAGQKLLEAGNQLRTQSLHTVAPLTLSVRIINNPEISYNNFMLLGLGLNGLQIALIILLTPIFMPYLHNKNKISFIFKNSFRKMILPYWLCSILIFLSLPYLAHIFYNVHCIAKPFDIMLLGSAFCLALIAISSFFSAISPNAVNALQTPLLYIMPGLLFSGLSWPSYAMNDTSLLLAKAMPLYYTGDELRKLILAGSSSNLLHNVIALYIMATIFFILAFIILKIRLTMIKRKEVTS